MYINITDSDKGNNKGSCGELVHYLDKENRISPDLKPELWFNGTSDDIPSYQVKHNLDHNIAKLCKNDAKFFLINISPSQKEFSFLIEQYGEIGVEAALKEYASGVMDEYACNFKRAGVNGQQDLLWYAKLEHYLYYGYNDPQVKEGAVKKGSIKPGAQMHIQVVASKEKKITLEDIQDRTGFSYSQVYRIVRGQNNISISVLIAVCKALELQLTDLFNFKIDIPKYQETRKNY